MPNTIFRCTAALVLAAGVAFLPASPAAGKPGGELGRYFGWEEPRIIVVDRGMGPAVVADMDGDRLNDLVVVNNAKSRIEIHRQRTGPRTEQELQRDLRVNRLPPSPWYDRVEVPVSRRVGSVKAIDVDGDGKPDLVCVGANPSDLFILRQKDKLSFEESASRRVPGLSGGPEGLEVADVLGKGSPQILALAKGKISIFDLSAGGITGEPVDLGSGGEIVALYVEDFNGDGKADVLGVIPESPTPLRLWLQQPGGGLGPEVRFEMPALVETRAIRFDGRKAASIGVIERASKRVAVYDLLTRKLDTASGGKGGEREAAAEVFGFAGGADKDRSVVVADVDGDGMPDLLATDGKANGVVVYRQAKGVGFAKPQLFSSFKAPKTVAVSEWDKPGTRSVLVLSEEEKVAGVAAFDASTGRMGFPQPLPVKTAGATPVAMNAVKLKDGPAAALVVKDGRSHTLEIHRPGGKEPVVVKLEGVSRPPQSIIAGDFDHDGKTDLILFTPGEPMVMVRTVDDGGTPVVVTDKTMPQYGLVQAAGPGNTAGFDFNGDGFEELLIADKNFVRACRFDAEKGWSVTEQITMPDATTAFSGVAVLEQGGRRSIVAADKANRRLVLMSRDDKGVWGITDKLRLSGLEVSGIRTGSFTGDGQPNVLVLSDDGFAVVRLGGDRPELAEVASYRWDDEDRIPHSMFAGDVNNDGFLDLVVLDAGRQMCQVLSFSAARKLVTATEFKVFESRLFTRGAGREFEPSRAIIADVTGRGLADLTLLVHDRLIVYPQAKAKGQ
ncbi:MAG: VCBS repeat-containing protein [Phycisphaerales bacterium]|nr:VCBS repeat-containing protein [Phycisphaerales bacterium]